MATQISNRCFSPKRAANDLLLAWLAATALSGIPSTVYALWSGADPWEATRAAGLMLLPQETRGVALFAAAAVVHGCISMFWAVLLVIVLPRRHAAVWSVAAACLIALLDLRLIAPEFFPSIARLEFWPQFADHVMWGALLGATLEYRWRRRRLAR